MESYATHAIIFILSLVGLSKGADYFVEYSSRLAKRFGVSDLVIGLTVTSIGTSLPELASSLSAAIQQQPGIIIGNVVGSNIANIGLIMGLTAMVAPLTIEKKLHDRDGYIMLASVLLFFAFSLNNQFEFWEALVFLALYVVYILFLISTEREQKEVQFRDFMKFAFDFEYVKPLAKQISSRAKGQRKVGESQPVPRDYMAIAIELGVVAVSCAAIIIGAKYLIAEAVWLAELAKLPKSIIGLTLIAVGTSLPELLVSIVAVRKGKGGLVVGNVIGSNIANLFLILGASGGVITLQISEIAVTIMIPFMLFFSLALLMLIRTSWRLSRTQGALTILAYISFITLAFWRGWSL